MRGHFLTNPHSQNVRMNGIRRTPIVLDRGVDVAHVSRRIFSLAAVATAALVAMLFVSGALA